MGSQKVQLALALVAACVVAAPLLIGDGVDYPDDALYYTVASWEWLRHAFWSSESIWFVPGKLGGVSLFADVVPMGPLYPAAWLSVLIPVVPALGIAVLLHALGTVLSVRWLARVHGASPSSATLAGAAVVLGPLGSAAFVDYHVDAWPTFLWLPVVLGCMERAAQAAGRDRRARLRWIALGGMALAALLLGSHLRLSASACGVIGLWTVVRWRDLPGALGVAAFGLLAGAPGYAPMLLEARIAGQGVVAAGLTAPVDQAIGLPAVAGWLAPTVFSVGRAVSLGTVLGLAALAALSRGGKGWPRESARLAIVVGVLLAAGSSLPGIHLVLAPLTLFSHPVNLVYATLATIPAAVLAARGLDRLVGMDAEQRIRWLRGPTSAVVGVLAGAAVLRLALGPDSFPSRYAYQLYTVTLSQAVFVGAVAGWLLFGADRRRRVAMGLFLLALADLTVFGIRAHLAVPSTRLQTSVDAATGDPDFVADGYLDIEDLASGFDSQIEVAWSLASDALEPRVVVVSGGGVGHEDELQVPEEDGPAMQAQLASRTWPPHLGMGLGVRGLAGRSKLMPERQLAALRPLAEAVHDIAAVEYVLQELFGHPGALGARTMALHGIPSAVWGDVIAFRIQEVAPVCYAPTRADVIADVDERVRRLLTNVGQIEHRPAVLETPLLERLPAPRPAPEHLSCSEDGTTDVSSRAGALVVRRERWHPGWIVRTQTGKRLRTFPVNQVHLGVVVEPGTARLDYRFVPPGLAWSLGVAMAAWMTIGLVILGLGTRRRAARATPRRRPPPVAAALLLGATALCLAPVRADAATIVGEVVGWSERADYEVLLTDGLDLSRAVVLARTGVQAGGAFTLETPAGSGDAWLFLRQSVRLPGESPLLLHLPLDLHPFPRSAPPGQVTFRSVPPLLASLRQRGEPTPGWWLAPVLMATLLFGFGLLIRWFLMWQLQLAAGAKLMAQVVRDPVKPPVVHLPLSEDRDAAPRRDRPPPPPPERRELLALAGVLVVALALRLRGIASASLDLIETTYGPGSRRVQDAGVGWLEALGQALWEPASLEVTHPPLYHWLLGFLGLFSDAAWLIRLPALAASVATVWLVWRLARRLSVAAGLGAAAMLAIAAPAVHFGHDATPYALMGLVAIGSLELLLGALERGTKRAWLAWFGLFVVSFLCHYTTAFFAFAQMTALATFVALRMRSTPWLGAGYRAAGAALLLAPVPLAWSLVHFAWFDPVAVDTRLFATVWPADPGLGPFIAGFSAVTAGVPTTAGLAAIALGLLALRGLVVVYRADRDLALLLLSMLAAFFGGMVFFQAQQSRILDGHVLWGFRWVSWMVPAAMTLAGIGAFGGGRQVRSPGRREVAQIGPERGRGLRIATGLASAALLAVWAVWAIPFTRDLDQHTTRPDYAAAAEAILGQLQDRDAVTTLPAWGQQGSLTWYLSTGGDGRFTEVRDGIVAWDFGGKALFAEAIFEDLPFESSARNAHFDRLWVALADERMFGVDKFDLAIAERAIDWAGETMVLQEEVALDHLRLYRFARRPGDLGPTAPVAFGPPELDLAGLPWLEPNAPGCVEGEPGEPATWLMNVRIPLAGGVEPRVRVDDGAFDRQPDPGYWTATVEGGPCDGVAPVLRFHPG
jgi:hypothetical protein